MNLTVRDAATLLDVSEKTIYRWIHQGDLPVFRIQDQFRFNRAELLEWATSRRLNVSPSLFAEPEGDAAPLPSLFEAVQNGGIIYRLEGSDRTGVLRALVDAMRLPEEVDREFLFQVLAAREELGSTAIGQGVAIPHVRNPVVLHVPRPTITLSFLERPVEFGALDGQPVHCLFAMVSPTVRAHLHMLSRLSFALRDEGVMAALRRVETREEILSQLQRIEERIGERHGAPAGTEGARRP
jgi:PTS system nitrogen regulatory IIA component